VARQMFERFRENVAMSNRVSLRFGVLLTAAFCALVFSRPAEATSIVTNGSFETGTFAGWTLGGNSGFIFILTSLVEDGTYAASFGAVGSDTTLSQSLTTTPGGTYNLSFWLQSPGDTPNDFSAFWDGQPALVSLVNAGSFPYTLFTFPNLLATTTSTNLQFNLRQDPSFWQLDNIAVDNNTAVPEPASMLLLGSGLAALAKVRRRAQRKR
jgi:PEP-CTERM motif